MQKTGWDSRWIIVNEKYNIIEKHTNKIIVRNLCTVVENFIIKIIAYRQSQIICIDKIEITSIKRWVNIKKRSIYIEM